MHMFTKNRKSIPVRDNIEVYFIYMYIVYTQGKWIQLIVYSFNKTAHSLE